MHPASYKIMESLLSRFVAGGSGDVVDFGSQDVNGTYRALFGSKWRYRGADLSAGKNVDIVMQPYSIVIDSDSVDLVISGQTIEHCRNPFLLVGEMVRVLKVGSPIILIAPFRWSVHRYPIDCWRFLPDGMQCLFDESGVKMAESKIIGDDCYAIGMKA